MLSQQLNLIRGYAEFPSPEMNPGAVLFLNHIQLFAAAVHARPYQPGGTGSLLRQALHVADQDIVRALVLKNVVFCLHILFHGSVMVQMFLVDVHQNSYMGRDRHIFQLMAGKLKHNPCVRLHFLHVVQGRYAYIPHQKGIHTRQLKQVIQECSDRTLALGSRDSDNLIPEALEKHLCLGQYTALIFFFGPFQDNAGTFKYNIIVIHTLLVIRAGMPNRTVLRHGGRSL